MTWRDALETRQISVYVGAGSLGVLAAATGWTAGLEPAIEPAIALMLFATFLQVPLAQLARRAFDRRLISALFLSNFVAVPLLVLSLMVFVPDDPLIRLGVAMVLLSPCVDYVVTFSRVGGADAAAMLAATPLLLVAQFLLLPIYLGWLLDDAAADLIAAGPFLQALIWLIAVPLVLAGLVQAGSARSRSLTRARQILDLLPVPSTALVLFLVFAAVLPRLGLALTDVLHVLPVYLAFAILAPVIGWWVARVVGLPLPQLRTVAFSTATRNSLIVLPLPSPFRAAGTSSPR